MRPSRSILAALLLLAGCQKLIGLEERTFVKPANDANVDGDAAGPDAGTEDAGEADAGEDGAVLGPPPSEEACTEYCDTVRDACKGDKAAFARDVAAGYCEGTCLHFATGDSDANTFECRLGHAKSAAAAPADNLLSCQFAGPGGGDVERGACASNCESFCSLVPSICPDSVDALDEEECLRECGAVLDLPGSADSAFGSERDTIQCRLAHLTAAAASTDNAQQIHCPHTVLAAFADSTPCAAQIPNCDDYCGVVQNVCATDQTRQYDSVAQCKKACAAWDLGQFAKATADEDSVANTVACRRYHAYVALSSPQNVLVHCPHAGPSGDGHCGTICNNYCLLASNSCVQAFADKFADTAACEAECAALIGEPVPSRQANLGYAAETAPDSGNTIQCRVYHATQAFTDQAACPAALGLADSKCAP